MIKTLLLKWKDYYEKTYNGYGENSPWIILKSYTNIFFFRNLRNYGICQWDLPEAHQKCKQLLSLPYI
jgi:hypothetical protein